MKNIPKSIKILFTLFITFILCWTILCTVFGTYILDPIKIIFSMFITGILYISILTIKNKNMKKIVKTIIVTILISLLCWITIFITDCNRTNNFKTPIFAIKQEDTSNIDNTYTINYYKGLGYKVEVKSSDDRIISITLYMFNKVVAATIT